MRATRLSSVRRASLVLVLLPTLVAAPILADDPPPADATGLVAAGKTAFAAGDHAGAFRLFRAAADADPTHPTALYNAALAARKAGLLVEAGRAYRELLQRAPGDLDVVYGLAEVERGLGNVAAARALYERFLAEEQRPAREALRGRARDALDALPSAASSTAPAPAATPAPAPIVAPAPAPAATPLPAPVVAPTSPPAPPLASPARRQEAEGLFTAGQGLSASGHHGDAAAKFLAAAERDPSRVDALLRAGLSLRRAGRLDEALGAYGRAVAHARATSAQRLDGTYGLAETHRLRGDLDDAITHFRRYIDGEDRPEEARFVERARAAIAELEARKVAAALPPTSTPLVPARLDAFFGDAAIVDGLLDDAAARRAAGDEAGARGLMERARALAPDDPRLAAPTTTPCEVERLLGRGEAALAKGDGPAARLAFQQALACDPTRTAPLWGLSRAADLVGDRVAGRLHARRYLEARGPDQDPGTARAAFFRSEAP